MTRPQIKEIIIPMPWGSIAGKTYGEEKCVPVLCVHGRSDNLETFHHILPLLPPNYFYVIIDLPCHGRSSHPDKGYILDLVWYSMCVKRVINHFCWTKMYYIGHSLGGQIGFLISAFYPELILKLVIIDTLLQAHVPSSFTAKALREYSIDPIIKLEKRLSSDEAPTYSLKEFVRKMIEARGTEVSEEQILPLAERNLIKIGPDQYKYGNDQRTKILGAIHFSFEQLEGIAKDISCPTLVILGTKSRSHIPLNRQATPLKKNSCVVFKWVEGDHDIHISHPNKVSALIVPFLTEETVSKL